ncbi:MAG: CoA transferase [Deltaproteobacteria bacterium]|nr:CoA transferase [Deltaproteobacteria bacterium]
MPAKPLKGLTVVDLSRLIPGPFCSLILSDLGARVIKVEDTRRPDYLREILPLFDALNRQKKIITVDFKSKEGGDTLKSLVKKADVLIESFRPGVLAKMGLSPAGLLKINRKLVVASITGFGQKGPNRNRAGHDLNYLSMAGLLNAEMPPVQYADLVGGGLFAALSIVSALVRRGKQGKGGLIDISMTDSMIFLNLAGLMMAQSGVKENILSGILARYRIYETSDQKRVVLAALEDKFWNPFCDFIGKPEWKTQGYPDAAPGVHEQLAAIFKSGTRDEWTALGERNDFCLTPVLSPGEVLESAQFKERKNFVRKGGMILPKMPIKLE